MKPLKKLIPKAFTYCILSILLIVFLNPQPIKPDTKLCPNLNL